MNKLSKELEQILILTQKIREEFRQVKWMFF